jgi:hypothetical protein
MMNSSNLLKEYLDLVISEGSTLTAAEMSKKPGRFDTFLSMIMNGDPFLTSDGEITIPKAGNKALIAALKMPDPERAQAYKDAFASGVKTSAGILTNPGKILKTQNFGGFAGRARSSDDNETQFANTINDLVSENGGPITVALGKKKIVNVLGAVRTGADRVDGQVSKADVILQTSSGDIKLSIKMKTADYYLSGDAQLAPIVGPIVNDLLTKKAPEPRIVSMPNSPKPYKMVTGPKAGTEVNMSFDIDPELAQTSVFGSGNNTVDLIVKGDLTKPEKIDQSTYMWPVTVFESVEELPESDQPVGLLRAGEAGRGFTYNGVKYTGIRPAIATKKRAANALKLGV